MKIDSTATLPRFKCERVGFLFACRCNLPPPILCQLPPLPPPPSPPNARRKGFPFVFPAHLLSPSPTAPQLCAPASAPTPLLCVLRQRPLLRAPTHTPLSVSTPPCSVPRPCICVDVPGLCAVPVPLACTLCRRPPCTMRQCPRPARCINPFLCAAPLPIDAPTLRVVSTPPPS